MGTGINTPLVGAIRAYAGLAAGTLESELPSAGSGWLYCNGAIVNIATYPDLFAVIGTDYGGDGITTFGLPNLRAKFPIGLNLVAQGNILPGKTGGSATQTLAVANLPAHTHTVTLTAAGTHSHTDTSSAAAGEADASSSDIFQGAHEYYIGNSISKHDGSGASKAIGVNENGPNGTVAGSFPQGPASNANSVAHTHHVNLAADSLNAAAHTLTITAVGTGATPAHENMPPYIALNFVVKY